MSDLDPEAQRFYKEVIEILNKSKLPFLVGGEPLDHFNVTAAFHAHAHFGSPQGKTQKGIPVYNCSRFVLEKINPEQSYVLVEI